MPLWWLISNTCGRTLSRLNSLFPRVADETNWRIRHLRSSRSRPKSRREEMQPLLHEEELPDFTAQPASSVSFRHLPSNRLPVGPTENLEQLEQLRDANLSIENFASINVNLTTDDDEE